MTEADRMEAAIKHATADHACGRDWSCNCGACRMVRAAGYPVERIAAMGRETETLRARGDALLVDKGLEYIKRADAERAHATTTAKLGRAVAALKEEIQRHDNHCAMTCDAPGTLARDVLADVDCAAAGEVELATANKEIARLKGVVDDLVVVRDDLWSTGRRYEAVLGRAAAALKKARAPDHMTCTCFACVRLSSAVDNILLDPDNAAAGEAWAEMEAMYKAIQAYRDPARGGTWPALLDALAKVENALAKVDARRGQVPK